MLVSTVLTTGQIAFIVRIVIETITSGGLFLIGLVVLGNAPWIASIVTHDTISRIAGGETSTPTAIKWLFKRRSNSDPTSSSKLAVAIALLLSYSFFVKLTDVGLIGFHTCTIPGPDSFDFPASVRDDARALELIRGNMVNGSEPNAVHYSRCAASYPFSIKNVLTKNNDTMYACTAWTNSTYGDKTVFQGLNHSDTAVLMPRQLMRKNYSMSNVLELNGYHIGPLHQRILKPTVTNGLLVIPHETGFRIFLGAPNPTPFTRYTLPQTLVLEGDVGCMTVGMVSQKAVYSLDFEQVTEAFHMDSNGSWREYAGPDYLRDVVSNTVDKLRDFIIGEPVWNISTLGEQPGFILGNTNLSENLISAAHVETFSLSLFDTLAPGDSTRVFNAKMDILGNCSERLESQLNVSTPHHRTDIDDTSCNFLQIGGSKMLDGEPFRGLSKMVCATGTQVNLAHAEVEVDGSGNINVTFERIPSDLHITRADWWFVRPIPGDTEFVSFQGSDRYALTPNPTGAINHPILPRNYAFDSSLDTVGPGNGADAFAGVGSMMLGAKTTFDSQFFSLLYLEEENEAIDFTPSRVTRWAGGMGASYIVGSSAFNGWAANGIQGGPITLTSTGGKDAICYDPLFAIAFIPLVLAAFSALAMALGLLFTSGLRSASQMKDFYAGLQPYVNFLFPDTPQTKTLLVWEHDGRPQLGPIENGQAIEISRTRTAVGHLHREKLNARGR